MSTHNSNGNPLKRSFAPSRVIQDITSQIQSGRLLPGDPLLSERGLAAFYGIGIASVRKALAALEEDGLIEKKWGIGNFVKGKPNNSKYIGVIVPNLTNPVFSEFLREINLQTNERNYHVVIGDADNYAEREELLIQEFAERGVTNILKFPNVVPEENRLRKKMKQLGMKFVILNDFWTDLPGKQVKVDEVLGTKMAMEHLLNLGHRRIAYLDYVEETREKACRTYTNALKEAGCFREEFVFLTDIGGLLKTGIEFLVRNRGILTACFTPYDFFAIHFLEILISEYQYRIPEDLAIVGFDDLAEASKPNISLTTLRQPKKKIVEEALELLLDSWDDSTSTMIRIPPELVIRNSTESNLKNKKEEIPALIDAVERRWAA